MQKLVPYNVSQDNMAAERVRPVEFRGLSTHYVMGEDIRVSFRYRSSSFQPHSEDRIKLYVRGARLGRDKSIASACVGDSSKHRLCDGGLYKTGSVTLATSTLSQFVTSQRSYVLLYGSGMLRQVVGKSDPFIICPQQEFPSIQIRTMEDSVYIEKLRAHSPIDDEAKSVGEANGGDNMSFVMVSDGSGVLGDWEALEGEEEREGEDGESLNDSESWSDVGDNLDPISLSSSSSELAESTESETETIPNRGGGAVPRHDTLASANSGQPHTDPLPPIPKPRRMNGVFKKTAAQVIGDGETGGSAANEDPQDIAHSHQQFQESKPGLLLSVLSGSDMTESVVIVEDVTQDKATLLKNANKELRTKVRVLHDKLLSVTEERDSLHTTVGELRGKMSSLKRGKSELKQKNKKLAEEKAAIKGKYKQLERENAVLTQHCEKQVVQISQYEAQLSTASRENEGLRRQLCSATKKSKRGHESSDQQPNQLRHEQTTDVPAVTSRKRELPPKLNKASQHGAFPRKPVIDIYVRDPPKKRDADKSRRETAENGHQKKIHKSTLSQHDSPPAVVHAHSDKETGTSQATVTISQRPLPPGILGKVVPSVRGGNIGSLSEEHIDSIMVRLKGGQQSFECPVCMRVLHSHETEFSAQLHVEQCLLDKERP